MVALNFVCLFDANLTTSRLFKKITLCTWSRHNASLFCSL